MKYLLLVPAFDWGFVSFFVAKRKKRSLEMAVQDRIGFSFPKNLIFNALAWGILISAASCGDGPSIEISKPRIGQELEDLTGTVEGLDGKEAVHALAVFIKVGGLWHNLPYYDNRATSISEDGSWKCYVPPNFRGGMEAFRVFLVGTGQEIPWVKNFRKFPRELENSKVPEKTEALYGLGARIIIILEEIAIYLILLLFFAIVGIVIVFGPLRRTWKDRRNIPKEEDKQDISKKEDGESISMRIFNDIMKAFPEEEQYLKLFKDWLLLFLSGHKIEEGQHSDVFQQMIAQCHSLRDRFDVFTLFNNYIDVCSEAEIKLLRREENESWTKPLCLDVGNNEKQMQMMMINLALFFLFFDALRVKGIEFGRLVHVLDVVKSVVQNIERKNRYLIDEGRLEIVNNNKDKGFYVISEEEVLSTVLNETINNAIYWCCKHSGGLERGVIRIEIRDLKKEAKEGFVQILVEDNGVGATQEKIKEIKECHERNQRVESEKPDGTGSGWGLLNAYKQISEFGGKLAVESDGLDSGFRVILWLLKGAP